MLQIPIFHVNGEDPEAVAQVVDLAVDFRQRFHRDALIELWCYRKHGHNEGDEPSYTQPHDVPGDRGQAVDPRRRTSEAFAATPALGRRSRRSPSTDADAIAAAQARGAGGRAGGGGQAGDAAAPEHVRRRLGARARAAPRRKVPLGADRGDAGDRSTLVGRALSDGAAGLHRAPQAQEAIVEGARGDGAPARSRSTGAWARRWRSARCWPRASACACRGRTSRRGTFSHRHARAVRLRDRRRVHAARAHPRQAGRVRGARQPAVRGGRARLRVRLQPGHARGAHDLGGAVRRLRERRAGDHRSVPRARRRRSGTG